MQELDKIREVIRQLSHIPVLEWEEFAAGLRVKKFHKGDFIIREGEIENHIYFLNTGATRHYFISDGKEFTVDFLFEGSFVTAYYSFITRERSTIFIEILEESETVVISREWLYAFYNKYHHTERIGRLIAESQYVKRLRREMDLLSLTAEQRYLALMEKNPALVNSISIKHLSSFLGIQPESLSRIRKQYSKN